MEKKKIKVKTPNFIKDDVFPNMIEAEYSNTKLLHICEKCGVRAILTPQEGFNLGWDYPPKMYAFKVISPRTCGNCGIEHTVWWDTCMENKKFEELSEEQHKTIARILKEPESIIVRD